MTVTEKFILVVTLNEQIVGHSILSLHDFVALSKESMITPNRGSLYCHGTDVKGHSCLLLVISVPVE
jgi:hypothetical protein